MRIPITLVTALILLGPLLNHAACALDDPATGVPTTDGPTVEVRQKVVGIQAHIEQLRRAMGKPPAPGRHITVHGVGQRQVLGELINLNDKTRRLSLGIAVTADFDKCSQILLNLLSNAMNITVICDILGQHEHDVLLAKNGQDAIDIFCLT